MLLGATGTIGAATAHALLRQGHEVVCLLRPRHGPNALASSQAIEHQLTGAQVRWVDPCDATALVRDGFAGTQFDALVSCMASRTGLPADAWRVDHQAHVQVLDAAKQAGVQHVVLLSAICVQKPLLAFQHAKLAFEQALKASGLTYSIVRPTAFFKSLSGQLQRVKQGQAFLLFGDGQGTACKPISDDDLADFMASCLTDEHKHNRILPIGGPGPACPGAEFHLAQAAQAARVPYALGVLSGVAVERAAELAPDVLWFQLYRFANDGHRIGLDLARRAQVAGVQALVLTIDTPIRTIRPREVKAGIVNPFKLTMRLRLDAISSPWWSAALLRHGMPRFASLTPYMKPGASLAEAAAFIKREQGGAFTWDEIARYRDVWKGPLVLKGALHPADAQRAVAMGVDGLFVTNHGGRQIDALPAAIDALPAIRAAVGSRATLIFDSGMRSGVDAARAIACGADAAFAGKSFLWSLGALGAAGPAHLLNIYMDDLRAAMGQTGCASVADLRLLARRHPGAWTQADYEARNAPGEIA